MAIAHSLGFPRIGKLRQMKMAVESFWKSEIDEAQLQEKGQQIRRENWALQADMGLELLSVGDFSWYDHMLDMSLMLGVIPERFLDLHQKTFLETYFQMARGKVPGFDAIRPCEMTKWFDTNYHYIVPELSLNQQFKLNPIKLFQEIDEAKQLQYRVKPIIIGPLTYLWLSKMQSTSVNKLDLIPALITVYQSLLAQLAVQQIEWVQIDEPILALDLPKKWRDSFQKVYEQLYTPKIKLLLTTYFGALQDNLELACALPTAGLHLDGIKNPTEILRASELLKADRVLSVGIIDGRNIWKTDLKKALELLEPLQTRLQDHLWIAGSCSFLHCPVDLDSEKKIESELKQWLAFSKQKTAELVLLTEALNQTINFKMSTLDDNQTCIQSKIESRRIHNPVVQKRCEEIGSMKIDRRSYSERAPMQQQILNLPLLPTTTIGSFPQTSHIRKLRQDFKKGVINIDHYEENIRKEIAEVVQKQLDIGIDVLVHGEPERNDMVEYFGERLEGFLFTEHGWVQSYGSRAVKPPIIYGDVFRTKPMTIKWSTYAQSLTSKPMKGMLTGPVTIVLWSFARDDQSRYETMVQVALALRDEVKDLEQAGIKIIQIDEPAFREGLPLRQNDWNQYLKDAVRSFKITAGCVEDQTQIHTHMCYSEFNDIISSIADMDADVISIECSRSNMELLESFHDFAYPNGIGPGIYDIHSPRIPTVDEMKDLIEKAAKFIPIEQLWINPDCGLKTRSWNEVEEALINMLEATNHLRKDHAK